MGIVRVGIWQPQAGGESPAGRLGRLDAALAGAPGLDLVLCPELFLSGYDVGPRIAELAEPRNGPILARAAEIAAGRATALAFGYPERADDGLFNAVAVIGRSGERLCDYRKRVLPPGFEGDTFRPGTSPGVFDYLGVRFAVLVCYDVEFPEYVRDAALAGATVVLAPTALRSKWTFVARKMIPTRAFENGLFVVYANHAGREDGTEYLGESVIVGPDGSELARAGDGERLLAADLDPAAVAEARATLPYLEAVGKRP